MAHPLNEQLSKRLSQSQGTAVGSRPLIRRLATTLLLGLALAAPAAHAQSVNDVPTQPAGIEQSATAASPALWLSEDTGLNVERFAKDMKQAGYSPGQAFSAQNWINRLNAPTFVGSTPLVGDALHEGLEDRAQWSASLLEAVRAGPTAFHLWENKTIAAMDEKIQSAVGGDFNTALVVLEYFDGLGIHPIEAMALINEGGWDNGRQRWEDLPESAKRDQFELPDVSAGGKQALVDAIDASGLRFVRIPATVLNQENAMGRIATLINVINSEVSAETGMQGRVLGLNGRVSWDMATPRGTGDDVEGFATEHHNGIMIRAAAHRELVHHEFYHALNYAIDPSIGRAPGQVSGHVVQLWENLRQMDLGEHAPQIERERWEGLRKLATSSGMSEETWEKLSSPESAEFSTQEISKIMRLDLVKRDKIDYIASNLHVLHQQAGQGVSFIDYRTAIITEFGKVNPLMSMSYYLDKEETLAYRTQGELAGLQTPTHEETWVAPTPTEAKLQEVVMGGFYADARAWQQQDLAAPKVDLQERLAARRASQEAPLDMGMSARAAHKP
jgi:hypothetical protein